MPNYLYTDAGSLASIPCPPWTDSWHPIPHSTVVHEFDKALAEKGIGVRGHKIATFGGGNRDENLHIDYTLDIPMGSGPKAGYLKLNGRSSIAKRYALSAIGGFFTMICENGMMGWSWTEVFSRKHTGGLDYDNLQEYIKLAVCDCIKQGKGVHSWQKDLATHEVSDDHMKILGWNLIEAGAIPQAGILKFKEAVKDEVSINNGNRTLYEIHAGVTRMLRGSHPGYLPKKNRMLKLVCDDYLTHYKMAA